MKTMKVLLEDGVMIATSKSTIGELRDQLGSLEEALILGRILLNMKHVCAVCQGSNNVAYSYKKKEHVCIEEYCNEIK